MYVPGTCSLVHRKRLVNKHTEESSETFRRRKNYCPQLRQIIGRELLATPACICTIYLTHGKAQQIKTPHTLQRAPCSVGLM